jgi:hypothetical protein
MILLSYPQGSDEWLLARAGAITASRFADARSKLTRTAGSGQKGDPTTTSNKYAWTVAMERIAEQSLDETFVTWQMKRGTELEPLARIAYEGRHNELVEESGIVLTDDRAFGYSTDGFIGDDGMVEIKCPSACDKIGAVWQHPENAADEYIDQINGGLWITGRQWCDLIVYCPWLEPVGKDLFIKRIERDDVAIKSLENDMLEFLARVDSFEAILRGERTAA